MNSYAGTFGAANNTYGLDINGNPCPPCPPETGDAGNGGGYEDYTGMGPTTLEETDLYQTAINISDARAAEDDPERPPNYRQKVTRRVEVPYTRKVKVPTTTTKVVPTSVLVKVPVKKLVQVPAYKIVDEEYTVFEDREAVREKEIWVKQVVPEKYIQKVPVKMTRQVKKPTQEIKEVEEMVEVNVPSTQAVQVEGYRIDDVEDTKVVEVEEFQEFEYLPHPTGNSELARTREIGRLPNSRIARNVGSDTFHHDHPSVRALDLDSNPGGQNVSADYGASITGQMGGMNMGGYGAGNGYGTNRPDPSQPNFASDNFTHTDYIRPAGKDLSLLATNTQMVKQASGGLGLGVKNTHTRHSDGTGVLVTRVDSGGAAALAGLLENDIITSINEYPTLTVEEFAAALGQFQGPIQIKFNRDGRRNIFCTLDRS